jgi:hypothetical protein
MRQSQPAVLVAFGCACLLASCGTAATSPSYVDHGASPRQQAAMDAARLLASVTPPPGSRRSLGVPPGGLALTRLPPSARSAPPPPSASGGVFMQLSKPPVGSVDAVSGGWWIARGSVDVVSSWLTRHPPVPTVEVGASGTAEARAAGARPAGRSHTTSATVDFQLAPGGHFALREILIGLVPGASGGTVVRVEAQSAWTAVVSAAAAVSARIAPVRACLAKRGFVIAGGGAAQSSGPDQPLGELIVRVSGSTVPAFIAFYPSSRAAQNGRSALTSNAHRFMGFVQIVGSDAVIWTQQPNPATRSALSGCLAAQ